MYFIFYFLFLILNITFADTILPLPIEDLRKIEMKYDDTLEIIKDWLLNFEVIHIPDIRNIDKNIFRHNIWLR